MSRKRTKRILVRIIFWGCFCVLFFLLCEAFVRVVGGGKPGAAVTNSAAQAYERSGALAYCLRARAGRRGPEVLRALVRANLPSRQSEGVLPQANHRSGKPWRNGAEFANNKKAVAQGEKAGMREEPDSVRRRSSWRRAQAGEDAAF